MPSGDSHAMTSYKCIVPGCINFEVKRTSGNIATMMKHTRSQHPQEYPYYIQDDFGGDRGACKTLPSGSRREKRTST